MTQEEFNAMLQVAIAQGLPGGSFQMKYSWEEIEAFVADVNQLKQNITILGNEINGINAAIGSGVIE